MPSLGARRVRFNGYEPVCKNPPMPNLVPSGIANKVPRLAAWVLISLAGCVFLVRSELAQQRELFDTDARIAHRLLSQQVVQHDAILGTLALLQPDAQSDSSTPPEQRLTALYPQIIGVIRRDRERAWPDAALASAEATSRAKKQPALADTDFANERYRVVLAADPASFALVIQARNMVPWSDWPMDRNKSPVQVRLEHAGQHLTLQPGNLADAGSWGWRLEFHKHLAAESQSFDVVALRDVSWRELPWVSMLSWCVAAAVVLQLLGSLQAQRAARRRAEELLRLGQVARLNTLGELAAGMAHELNQPLTAVLANSQAAQRLLNDAPPDIDTAREAMKLAAEQARRASDVVTRLRRAVERPDAAQPSRDVDLRALVAGVIDLLEPEVVRRKVSVVIDASYAVSVRADPVALEQIVHNLIMNAIQAMDGMPEKERQLTLLIAQRKDSGVLEVSDSGPGIAPEALPRIFEPFFSTKADGLGLGLSLCETLAAGMGGSLSVSSNVPRGAVFTLQFPLSSTSEASES